MLWCGGEDEGAEAEKGAARERDHGPSHPFSGSLMETLMVQLTSLDGVGKGSLILLVALGELGFLLRDGPGLVLRLPLFVA